MRDEQYNAHAVQILNALQKHHYTDNAPFLEGIVRAILLLARVIQEKSTYSGI